MGIKGPGVAPLPGGITTPTSHVDLIPTLLGLAGINGERAAAGVAQTHREARPLPGRDLSGLLGGSTRVDTLASPIYFMTEDDITGLIERVEIDVEHACTSCAIREDIVRFALGTSMLQLVSDTVQENEPNEALFLLLYRALSFLAYGEADATPMSAVRRRRPTSPAGCSAAGPCFRRSGWLRARRRSRRSS